MKQLDSTLPCVCSGRDTRWCHPVLITDTWQRLVCHFFVLTMHILTASVKETIYLSPIHVYSGLFQSFSLVKQSEIAKGTIIAALWKRERGLGLVGKWGSWFHNMTRPSLLFSLLCYSRIIKYGTAFYQLNARNSLYLISHTHMLLFHCLQFVPGKQFLSQAAGK